MKIECPACHLTGKINEVELPPEGKTFECPKCKASFYVEKPNPSASGEYLMNMCPVCQYSTFTDEMFAVCPKCGTNGSDYRNMLLKKKQGQQPEHRQEPVFPEEPPPIMDHEQIQREYELLTRSRRNPDLAAPPPPEAAPKKPALPLAIRITGWTLVAAGCLLLVYGLLGLKNYYGEEVQTLLSTPYIETMFKVKLFFQYGFFPWMKTIFSVCFLVAASQFLRLQPWAPRVLKGMCLGGITLLLTQELAGAITRIFSNWGSVSAIFYIDCLVSFLITGVLWSIPFLASIWLMTREETVQEYEGALASAD